MESRIRGHGNPLGRLDRNGIRNQKDVGVKVQLFKWSAQIKVTTSDLHWKKKKVIEGNGQGG